MKRRVLLLEDESSIAENIMYALGTEGFECVHASRGNEGLKRLSEESFDLVILDVGLPDLSGFEVCRKVRETSTIPLFFLTARSDEIDRILGLELGADDYITKPFSPRELAARAKSLFRRMETVRNANASESGEGSRGLRVDAGRYQAWMNDVPLDLRRYEFGILKLLADHPGQVFSRAQIMDRIWDTPDMSLERTVDAHVKAIRSKIAAVTDEEWVITHRGIGYSMKER